MIYLYTKLLNPNLDMLESSFLLSQIAGTYLYFRWDEADKLLKVYLTRELTSEEKLILDAIVEGI